MDLMLGTRRGNGISKFTTVDGAPVPTAGAPGAAVAAQPVADASYSGEYLAQLHPHLLQFLTEACCCKEPAVRIRKGYAGRRGLWEALDRPMASQAVQGFKVWGKGQWGGFACS